MAFHQAFVSKVRKENILLLKDVNNSSTMVKKEKAAATVSRNRLAKAAEAVTASRANNDKHMAQYTEENTNLVATKQNAAEAAAILSSLQTKMEIKEEG